MLRNILKTCRFNKITIPARSLNANTASITKIHRSVYAKVYPTVVVLSDGSSIVIRYHEPRKIIKMPLDISSFSDQERKAHLEKRKPKTKVVIEDDIEDNFKATKYLSKIKQSYKK